MSGEKKEVLYKQRILQYSKEVYIHVCFNQGFESHSLCHSVPAPGMETGLLVCTQAILFLPSFCLQAAVPAYCLVFSCTSRKICSLSYSPLNSMFS